MEQKKTFFGWKDGVMMALSAVVGFTAGHFSRDKSSYEPHSIVYSVPSNSNLSILTNEYFDPVIDPILSLDVNKFESLSIKERKERLEVCLEKSDEDNDSRTIKLDYVVDNLKSRSDLDRYLANPTTLRNDMIMSLNFGAHSYRPGKEINYDESLKDIKAFSFGQLLRVYLMLDALQDQDFIDNIGLIINYDLADPYSEHGGDVKFNAHAKPFFQVIPSIEVYKEDTMNNGSYNSSSFMFDNERIAGFHLHATSEDDTKYSGPSSPDLNRSDIDSFDSNESHQFVITKLKGDRFNIDYYGRDNIVRTYPHNHVLDLGVYEYNANKNETK